jgi:hypothetical protein
MSMRRIMRIWDSTPPSERQSGSFHPLIWKGANGREIRFLVVETGHMGAPGRTTFDWHPEQASSHAYLERILEEPSTHPARQPADQ